MELLATGLSARGLADVHAVMQLEEILAGIERSVGRPGWQRRHPDHYWFRVPGEPRGELPWAWKVGGHHLAVHLTIVGEQLSGTPLFYGANPATVPDAHPQAGLRALPADVGRIPAGLAYAEMDDDHRRLLVDLVRHHLGRAIPAVSEAAWLDIEAAGLENVSFRWAGPVESGHGHYYAVLGPMFLLEYDNTQNDANHIHTVWRDLRRDWTRTCWRPTTPPTRTSHARPNPGTIEPT